MDAAELKAITDEALARLKTLLGITDDEQDAILSLLVLDAENMIMGYCRIDFIPSQLESLIPMLAADMYRGKGYGSAEKSSAVKKIVEGEREVEYAEEESVTDFLAAYYERLKPFRARKGYVPSDIPIGG
ncbi:MAG: phage head-tail connector protein [Oscillospiraceae bacterium]|nr:phage head-tail connector protein [Oscillospiraceae bacterium]